jgi:hypothetical protein
MHVVKSPLGLIPNAYFSGDAAINPAINPHVRFPPGYNQSTLQPQWGHAQLGCYGGGCRRRVELEGLGLTNPLDVLNEVGDSWWWKNRKAVGIGALALAGLAVLGVAKSILR